MSLLILGTAFLFTGCGGDDDDKKTQNEISLTKENCLEYLSFQILFEDYSTSQKQVSQSYTEHTATATAKLVVSRKGGYNFQGVEIGFVLSILPFKQASNGLPIQGTITVSYDGNGQSNFQVSASSIISAPQLPAISENSITIKSVAGSVK